MEDASLITYQNNANINKCNLKILISQLFGGRRVSSVDTVPRLRAKETRVPNSDPEKVTGFIPSPKGRGWL
jgi:hypothetical protein